MSRRLFLSFLLVLAAGSALAQRTVWAASAGGLSLRTKASSKGTLIRKVPYGEQLQAYTSDSAINTEGFLSFWTKVRSASDSGYAVDAYLVPVMPPKAGTESLRDWTAGMGRPAFGPVDSTRDGIRRSMMVYSNGAVLTVTEGGDYYAEMLVLPDVSVEEAYLLARVLVVLNDVMPARPAFPREAGKEPGKSWRVSFHPDEDPYLRWCERLSFERRSANDAVETVEIVHLEDGVAISYSTGS